MRFENISLLTSMIENELEELKYFWMINDDAPVLKQVRFPPGRSNSARVE